MDYLNFDMGPCFVMSISYDSESKDIALKAQCSQCEYLTVVISVAFLCNNALFFIKTNYYFIHMLTFCIDLLVSKYLC